MKLSVGVIALALGIPTIVAAQDMKGMDMQRSDQSASKGKAVHKASGVVKKVDAKAGTATLAHAPVKSMNWPAMTMTFQVKDKAMLDKLDVGQKIEFEFEQRGKEHVITSVR